MLNNLKPTEGSRKKSFKRCRGAGSGLGKNGGFGKKGQRPRTGGGVWLGIWRGEISYFKRFQKKGIKKKPHIWGAVF